MSEKVKVICWTGGGFIGIIVLFISVMTWFYPYSVFSVDKSLAYQPDSHLYNGKQYAEILSEFKDSYQKDLEADMSNKNTSLIINRTQYILPIFEQEWLVRTNSVPIDDRKMNNMIVKVKNARDTLLELLVQVDLTRDQRDELVHNLKSVSSLEERITDIEHKNYATRGQLKRQLDRIHSQFISTFRTYIVFYERAT